MQPEIIYRPVEQSQTPLALELALLQYREEAKAVPCLPDKQELQGSLTQAIRSLFAKGNGIAAFRSDRMIGFLAGIEIDSLWSSNKGVVVPLYGHAAVKAQRTRLYQELYRRAAQLWVRKSCTSHAVTLYAHDKQSVDTWFWLGFGLRCVDAIRSAKLINTSVSDNIRIKKASSETARAVGKLSRGLCQHLTESPMFMPRRQEDPVQDLIEWLSHPEHHMWIAYYRDQAVGYIRIQPQGESFVSHHPAIMNITSAYVLENQRGRGIGKLLLNHVQHWLLENSIRLCGVDFESFNPEAKSFWNNHFEPYSVTVVRRIDERILDF